MKCLKNNDQKIIELIIDTLNDHYLCNGWCPFCKNNEPCINHGIICGGVIETIMAQCYYCENSNCKNNWNPKFENYKDYL